MSWRNRILLGAVSGLLAWPVHYGLDRLELSGWWGTSYVSIGAVFGALVLAPLVPARRQRIGAVAALVLGSIVIYGLVVEFAVDQYGPLNLDYDLSIVVSGLLGALLVGILVKVAVPLRTSGSFWAAVAGAGLFGGLVFSLAWESRCDAIVVAGYLGWQIPVCLALCTGAPSKNGLQSDAPQAARF